MNNALHKRFSFAQWGITIIRYLIMVGTLGSTVCCAGESIAVIGTGYVGLVTGAGLAECNNSVVCVDIDERKINLLKEGHIPIYEPGLKQLVEKNVLDRRLTFSSDIKTAIKQASTIFIAVGTPMDNDGKADLSAYYSVLKTISMYLEKYTVLVTKSTVPIGTGQQAYKLLTQQLDVSPSLFDLVSNPEFLREGSAVKDFMNPDRIVIGTDSITAQERMARIYQPIIQQGVPLVSSSITTAESIKYAANACLAARLSFINEIANLCDATGADAQQVALAIGLDKRIGPHFLKPGPGFGGSCFPKDTHALLYTARQFGINLDMVAATIAVNECQHHKPIEKLEKLMKSDLSDKTIAILGLSFKANTDDIRYSPALYVIDFLMTHNATIKAYDPVANDIVQREYPSITYCTCPYEALADADAVIIMTEWPEFQELDIAQMATLMHQKIIIDARNMLDPLLLKQYGFACDNIGQSYLCK